MKVVFASNFLNQHQLPVCNAFLKAGTDFHFAAMEHTPASRLSTGYADMNTAYDFVVRAYEDKEKAEQLIEESDVFLIGGIQPNELTTKRMSSDKPVFYYAERFYKKGAWHRFNPKSRPLVRNNFLAHAGQKNFYVLCASAYLPNDLNFWKFPMDKCLKWGYFPDTGCTEEVLDHKTDEILWCGRMIDWKHPELAVLLAEHRQKTGKPVHITMIGSGDLHDGIAEQIQKKNLDTFITLKESIPYTEIYTLMQKAGIFLFTSDKQEGWGAVLNEAMQSGCACIGCRAAGSVPYLIEDGKTGVAYSDPQEFLRKADQLIDDSEQRRQIQKLALQKIHEEWNAETAVSRLLAGAMHSKEAGYRFPEEGPFSKAPLIKG